MLVHNTLFYQGKITMCALNLKCEECLFINFIVSSSKSCRITKSSCYLEKNLKLYI
jgi:hypothetical protein